MRAIRYDVAFVVRDEFDAEHVTDDDTGNDIFPLEALLGFHIGALIDGLADPQGNSVMSFSIDPM